jgi:hypothetical protein
MRCPRMIILTRIRLLEYTVYFMRMSKRRYICKSRTSRGRMGVNAVVYFDPVRQRSEMRLGCHVPGDRNPVSWMLKSI